MQVVPNHRGDAQGGNSRTGHYNQISCSTIGDFLKVANQLFGGYFCWLLGTIHIYSVRRTDSIKINIFWKCIWALRTVAKYTDKLKYAIDQIFHYEEDAQHRIPCVEILDWVLWDLLLSYGTLALLLCNLRSLTRGTRSKGLSAIGTKCGCNGPIRPSQGDTCTLRSQR